MARAITRRLVVWKSIDQYFEAKHSPTSMARHSAAGQARQTRSSRYRIRPAMAA